MSSISSSIKTTVKAPTVTSYGNSLSSPSVSCCVCWSILASYHGILRPICVCIVMNCANTPRQRQPPTITIRIQKLSWASGHRYLRFLSTAITSVVILCSRDLPLVYRQGLLSLLCQFLQRLVRGLRGRVARRQDEDRWSGGSIS